MMLLKHGNRVINLDNVVFWVIYHDKDDEFYSVNIRIDVDERSTPLDWELCTFSHDSADDERYAFVDHLHSYIFEELRSHGICRLEDGVNQLKTYVHHKYRTVTD